MKYSRTGEAGTDIQIETRVVGRGPGVLYIHGWNHSRRIWNSTISEIGDGITSVAIDLPGFGNSPPLPSGGISLFDYASLTAGIIHEAHHLLEERNDALHTVVGDSLGALLILELLQRENAPSNQKVADVSLTSPKRPSEINDEPLTAVKCPAIQLASRIVLSGCPVDGLPAYTSSIKSLKIIKNSLNTFNVIPTWASKRLLRVMSLGTVHRFGDVNEDLIESVLQTDPKTSEILFHDIADYSLSPEKINESNLTPDFLVVRGEWDRVTSETRNRDLASYLDGSYQEIPKVGHTPMIEAPQYYAKIIKEATEQ